MEVGARISREILEQLNYPSNKINRIQYYVSIHDNWAFNDKEKDKLLGIFRDLDFIWMVTSKGFFAVRKILCKNSKEMIKYIESEKVIFSSRLTKKLYKRYLKSRKKELKVI